MKDRLIELIQNAVGGCARHWAEVIADNLLAGGVIVPPMALKQICYAPHCYHPSVVEECRVSSITQKANGTFKIRLTYLLGRRVFEITPDKIGKTVFLTREEAEKRLAEGRRGQK